MNDEDKDDNLLELFRVAQQRKHGEAGKYWRYPSSCWKAILQAIWFLTISIDVRAGRCHAGVIAILYAWRWTDRAYGGAGAGIVQCLLQHDRALRERIRKRCFTISTAWIIERTGTVMANSAATEGDVLAKKRCARTAKSFPLPRSRCSARVVQLNKAVKALYVEAFSLTTILSESDLLICHPGNDKFFACDVAKSAAGAIVFAGGARAIQICRRSYPRYGASSLNKGSGISGILQNMRAVSASTILPTLPLRSNYTKRVR